MISVSKLTKYYGEYPAVRDVSFQVDKGQVVGFLLGLVKLAVLVILGIAVVSWVIRSKADR